jgi:hypothetical protein
MPRHIHDAAVKAEVWVTNEENPSPIRVEYLSLDAAELSDVRERDRKDGQDHVNPPSEFRDSVVRDTPYLEGDGRKYTLTAGKLVPPRAISEARQ